MIDLSHRTGTGLVFFSNFLDHFVQIKLQLSTRHVLEDSLSK